MCLVLLICTLTLWSSMLGALMVESMSVVVNIMLSPISVMSPPPALYNLSVRTVVKLCTLGVFALGATLVSWIVMTSACVLWISILSSSSLFLNSVYDDLKYTEISLIFTAGHVCLWGCNHVVVLGLYVRLSRCPVVVRWLRWLWWVYCCLSYMWVWWESVWVTEMLVWGMGRWVHGMSM